MKRGKRQAGITASKRVKVDMDDDGLDSDFMISDDENGEDEEFEMSEASEESDFNPFGSDGSDSDGEFDNQTEMTRDSRRLRI